MRRAVLLAALLLSIACIREKPDVSQDSPRQPEAATANPQAGPGQDTSLNPTVPINADSPTSRVPAAADSSPAGVQLIEYQIRMPDGALTAGSALRVVNAGKEKHAFAVEGASLRTSDLNPAESGPITLNLTPGTYTVYCPLPGHRERGMSRTMVVK